MPEPPNPEDYELVAGRECGTCNVCCVALTIEDPKLTKLQGYRCKNTRPDNLCGIYETRPDTCRTFFCGWRRLKWVREGMRPDQSGVLVRLHGAISEQDGSRQLGVMITLLTAAALKAEGLAETVGAAVAARVPVYLHIPGPPGYTASTARINDALIDAVLARDKKGVLEILRTARTMGLRGEHVPIVLAPQA
jgi:hypothetical protein